MDAWNSDLFDVEWVKNRKGVKYDDGMLDEDKIKDSVNTGIFTYHGQVEWTKVKMHRSQATKISHFMGK
jgi:hypothetical protein